EVLGPVVAVGGAGPVNDGDADIFEVGTEDVGAVARAAHPGVHHRLRGGLPCRDVLTVGVPVVAGRVDPLSRAGAVRAGVAQGLARRHIARVLRGGRVQRAVAGEGRQAVGGALLVDQRQYLGGHVLGAGRGE